MKTPNEKVCEELFLMYAFMRVYRLRGHRMVIYAPTLHEEKDVGYDAKADIGCRELYIQFKRAEKSSRKCPWDFQFEINTDQLKTLKNKYPYYSVFYVVGSFDSVTQLNEDQRNARIPQFLDRYLAIPAHLIDDPATEICFCSFGHRNKSVVMSCLPSIDGHRTLERYKPLFEWFYGDELLREFETGKYGAVITRIDNASIERQSTDYVREIQQDKQYLMTRTQRREFDDIPDSLRSDSYGATLLRLC
jgi:hypothetical protein